MRVGQKNKLTYRWARKGSRPRAAHDQRTQSTYLFGAVCPDRGAGAALVLPACNCEPMQLHLDEIATKVALGAHAIILLDQAGWHGAKALVVPNNISLVPLPPRAPELNGQENIWQFMRQNWLSNRIFTSFDDIVDHCCYAWNTLIDQTLEDYVHRATRLGSSRSLNLRIGINLRDMASWASTSIAGEGSETSVVCSLHWRRIVIANWATGAARAAGCAKYFCSRTCAIRRRCIAELPPSKRGSDAERWRSCAN